MQEDELLAFIQVANLHELLHAVGVLLREFMVAEHGDLLPLWAGLLLLLQRGLFSGGRFRLLLHRLFPFLLLFRPVPDRRRRHTLLHLIRRSRRRGPQQLLVLLLQRLLVLIRDDEPVLGKFCVLLLADDRPLLHDLAHVVDVPLLVPIEFVQLLLPLGVRLPELGQLRLQPVAVLQVVVVRIVVVHVSVHAGQRLFDFLDPEVGGVHLLVDALLVDLLSILPLDAGAVLHTEPRLPVDVGVDILLVVGKFDVVPLGIIERLAHGSLRRGFLARSWTGRLWL
mmetsp:Transcript_62355/g.184515  ORF Transcript_62355/g.184515 Transcript_62355/m.184515 type:complete len:282 (-) Transcript_62355:141-986(-)